MILQEKLHILAKSQMFIDFQLFLRKTIDLPFIRLRASAYTGIGSHHGNSAVGFGRLPEAMVATLMAWRSSLVNRVTSLTMTVTSTGAASDSVKLQPGSEANSAAIVMMTYARCATHGLHTPKCAKAMKINDLARISCLSSKINKINGFDKESL